jgi:hypothetical protein
MELDDPQWSNLQGGYRVAYDPRKAFAALEQGKDTAAAWQELWNELHHQGDVGEASYASIPHLVRIYAAQRVPSANTYSIAATVELARHHDRNPGLPNNFEEDYRTAWQRLVELGLHDLSITDDPDIVSSIIAVLAIAKGQLSLGRFALYLEDHERSEILSRSGWTD